MDLSNIEISETVDVEIMHPVTGVETDMVITVYTTDSAQYKKAMHYYQNRAIKKGRMNLTAEEIDERAKCIIAKCSKEFKNVVEKGEPVVCNFENALSLYKKHAWIYEQIDRAMGDRTGFLLINSKD